MCDEKAELTSPFFLLFFLRWAHLPLYIDKSRGPYARLCRLRIGYVGGEVSSVSGDNVGIVRLLPLLSCPPHIIPRENFFAKGDYWQPYVRGVAIRSGQESKLKESILIGIFLIEDISLISGIFLVGDIHKVLYVTYQRCSQNKWIFKVSCAKY